MHAQINTRFDPAKTIVIGPKAAPRPARALRKEDAGVSEPAENSVMTFLRRLVSAAKGYGF